MRLLALLAYPLLLAAAPAPHPYADATRRRIATAQDERNTAALLPFLADKNATYRAAAALAFGSVQDRAAVPALLPLLADKAPAVRRAAAFALGQTGDSTAAPTLAQHLPQAATYAERLTLAEAFGRCATRTTLLLLWQALPAPGQLVAALPRAAPRRRGSRRAATAARRPAAPAPDTVRSTALAWGLYRAGLRGLLTPDAAQQLASLLSQPRIPQAARRGAAAALVRARGGAALDSAVAGLVRPVLLRLMAADPDYFVRVNCATVLGRFRQPGVLPALLAATSHADARVRIAALRALPERPYGVSEAVMETSLRRPLAQEALVAAEWLLRTRPDSPPPNLLALAQTTPHYRARATLLQAALRYAYSGPDRAAVADTIRQRLRRAPNPYEKAALLTALSEDFGQFEFLANAAGELTPPLVVPGTALAALVAMRQRPGFPSSQQLAFQVVLRRALFGGDVTQLGTAAEALADPKLVPAPVAEDLAALRAAQARLTIPRDIEAWLSIQQALNKINKVAVQAPPAPPSSGAPIRPISWDVVQGIPVGQRVRISTNKGLITMVLKVEEAPGSVATFVQLVRRGFYNGLYFHRVVPDFVAQGGDPRGDGSGSLPYTLRSEFSYLPYDTGAVGLASAGKDTESCQFFFTHLPTPHLDGRYTVFAQVVDGQDVVQRLEVGDQMLRVELL